jgi:SnoaL-like domain
MNTQYDLQTLSDKEAIRELRHQYGYALDTRNWALFVSLFDDQVDADFSAFGIPRASLSGEGIAALTKPAFARAGLASQQLYSVNNITVDGDHATCFSYLSGFHEIKDTPGGDTFELRAAYYDELIRRNGVWKIKAIRLQVISARGNFALVS